MTGPGAESTIFALSVTFVRAADPQQVLDALAAYYAAVGRPGPETVAAEAEHQLVTWEDGYEPEPSMPLNLLISPLEGGWVAIAFRGATTFDLPFTAWLALKLQSETIAAYSWGDGYGCVAFKDRAVAWSGGHIRDERSDMHLRQILRGMGIPFDGDEDRSVPEELSGWRRIVIPPRPWPPLLAGGGAAES